MEHGLRPVAKANAERLAAIYDVLAALDYLLEQSVDMDLAYGIGLTEGEEEARAKGLEVRVGKFPFLANGRARSIDDTDGLVKIVADARTDRLLGAQILGPHASDLIAELAIAMEFSASAEDVGRACHAHPTLPEAIKEAALASEKRAIHI